MKRPRPLWFEACNEYALSPGFLPCLSSYMVAPSSGPLKTPPKFYMAAKNWLFSRNHNLHISLPGMSFGLSSLNSLRCLCSKDRNLGNKQVSSPGSQGGKVRSMGCDLTLGNLSCSLMMTPQLSASLIRCVAQKELVHVTHDRGKSRKILAVPLTSDSSSYYLSTLSLKADTQ